MTKTTFKPRVNGEHVSLSEIGDALINEDTGLSPAAVLRTSKGAATYLPEYRDASQRDQNKVLFAPSLTEDGTLILYLVAGPPPALVDKVGSATMRPTPPVAALEFSDGQRLALEAKPSEGGVWKLHASVPPALLPDLRKVLFDAVPNARVVVTRAAPMAAPLTAAFVRAAWTDPALHSALLATFGGSAIPVPDAATFLKLASRAYPRYTAEYMLIDCEYVDEVPMPPLPGFIERRLKWGDATYSYFEDNYRPGRVHYLPDRFALAVEPSGAPTVSLLKFATSDGSLENTVATFRFLGMPQIDRARIEDAGRQLAAQSGRKPEFFSLQYASGVTSAFTLFLPNASGAAGAPKPQPNAIIDLDKGIRNEIILSLPAFQALWAAIFGDRQEQTLFAGWVDVGLSAGNHSARVEFVGRLDRGEMAAYFDRIIDAGADLTYASEVTVKVPAAIFSANRKPQVVAIGASFGPGSTASIDAPVEGHAAPMLSATVNVRRSVADILLGRATAGAFPYVLKVVTLEGARCGRRTAHETIVYVTEKDIAACVDPCD